MNEILDIKYKNSGLSSTLSNLYPHVFKFNGYKMVSMEGFLQSLKISNKVLKEQMFNNHGYNAWMIGQKYDWTLKQELYWNNKTIDRHSETYNELITSAYDAIFEQNNDFKNALIESLEYKLDHSIGQTNPKLTILTKSEYLHQLNRLREKLKPNRFFDLNSILNI